MKTKEFKTLDEQVEILKNKGLTINDVDKTKSLLLRENYFFINGYRHVFLKSDKQRVFIKGSTFDELYAVFQFDRSFRNVLFKNLLIVENNLKSIISYRLSKKYGIREKDYLKPSNFSQDIKKVRQVNDVLNKIKRQIKLNGRQHSATLHYLSNYGYVPLWILVKLLSFGMINELYSILKPEDKLSVAEYYNLDVETLGIYISLLSNYRNLCAHEDIVYEHRTQKEIPDTRYHRELDIPMMNDEYIYGKNDIFAVVIMLKYMLTESDFTDFVNEVSYDLSLLDGRVSSVPQSKILDRMGFPENWEEISKIK
ncbi:MAG TPA: Abi family protein [Candidatus Aphodocola excrementigallinarum]|uniref:Abi family protein n=1 Tax=Candidatus Aphodocola excrementigallinarum TaxID=2840670 RepID=A0A9D1IQ66_9FIRM|nr:Abi family protein [Candidatus Aphodocola excrementigallinarum]